MDIVTPLLNLVMICVLVLICAFNAHTDGENHNIRMATLLHRMNIEQH